MRFVFLILAFLLSGCVFGKPRTAHDNTNPAGPWGYYSGTVDTRWDADGRMFYNAMRCSGVGVVEAKTMYYSLLRFGWHWKFSVKKAKPVLPDSSSDLLKHEPRTTTLDPSEVDTVQQWIRQNNPTLDQIESRVDSKGR